MEKILQRFFRNLYGEDQTNFRCIKSGSVMDLNSYYNENAHEILQQFNEQNYEIYFVPNTGGFKDSEITKFNCCFIDLDCGRDDHGNYLSLDEVKEYKDNKIQALLKSTFKPSWIIETRNGLHAYWILNDEANKDQFSECEHRLISYYDADKKVKNPARLMRVPNFYWCKDIKNKFMVKVIEENDSSFNIGDLLESLPKVSVDKKCVNERKKYDNYSLSLSRNPATATGGNIHLIKQQDISSLQAILKPTGVKVNSHEEFYDYIKKQDLNEFLGLCESKINCLFHNDENPSAGVVINEENDHNIYNCMSDKCDVSLTIIQVVERIIKSPRVNALRFLRKVYKVEYEENEWKKSKKDILEENQRLILGSEITSVYPEVDKMISKYASHLCTLNTIAIQHLQTENFTDKNDNPIFFSSVRYLSHCCGIDKRRMSNILSLFTYLGLIRKVPESEIPEFLLNTSKHEAAKKKQRNIVGYYSIPPYGELTFAFTKMKVKEYKELGFTMRGWGRELILRTLGEDEADRVFPQMFGVKISERNHDLTSEIEKTAFKLIKHKGYTTEKEILEFLLQSSGKKVALEIQIKRVIPDFLRKYDLTRERLNNQLKNELSIKDMNGYPFVIYK
jgi:hypothetical protein